MRFALAASVATALLVGCVADTMRSYVGQDIRAVELTYGPPINYEMTNIETSEGDIGNASWTWNNGISSIRADLLGLDLDHMSLTFTYEAFMRDIEAQERATTSP